MQYDDNAEKYGYEGEMTPLKCDELKAHDLVDIQDYRGEVYLKKDVDAAIDELKVANKLLKEHIANGDVSRITWIDEVIELKQKLEDVQASMYCDVVDANMENRRLKRALWLTRTEMARTSAWVFWNRKDDYNYNKWKKIEFKCRKKAEEYK